jgi:HD-GYP domain-containing protein (c-di-GMP phosphodiesterase class II)
MHGPGARANGMRLIPTSNVPDGAELGRDVIVGRIDGTPLLRAGTRITPTYRAGLKRAGIHAIYIQDQASEGITPPGPIISEETQTLATRAVAAAYEEAKQALEASQALPPHTAEALANVVGQILIEIKQSGGVAVAFADLSSADAYTFQHSVDVAALGLLLATRIFEEQGWPEAQMHERLLLLGIGLLVHDIGKLAVPSHILHKRGALTLEEVDILRSHPELGFDLLQGSEWSHLVKSVVLRHHERWDGSGYPGGLRRTEIHEMARIAAVADVYDAITSERVYAQARPARVGVRVILDGAGRLFDPEIVRTFSRLVAPFPIGTELQLVDGRRAIVGSVPQEALDRPVVRVIDGPGAPYDLSLLDEESIGIAGWDVTLPAAA